MANLLCLFCDQPVHFETSRDGSKSDASKVHTHDFVKAITNCAAQRCDEWSYRVKGKVEYFSSDLHAADAVYHRSCSTNFRVGKKIPLQYTSENIEKQKSGRPENVIQQNAFIATCCFFENNDEGQLALSDLIGKMEDFLKDTEYSAYDRRHMKRKFLDFYGQDIIISGGRGAPVIVTYRQTANSILRDYYNKPKDVDINLQKNPAN